MGLGFRVAIIENQMEKKMENEMETRVIQGLYWGYSILFGDTMVGFRV